MSLPQEAYLHKGHLIQNGVPTSEHGTIQLTNTFASGQVRITTGLEKVEEGGEVEVGMQGGGSGPTHAQFPFDEDFGPQPNQQEGERWVKQAEVDFDALMILLNRTPTSRNVSGNVFYGT